MARPVKSSTPVFGFHSIRRRVLRVLRRFGVGRVLGLAILVAVFAVRVWDPAPVRTLRLHTFDLYQSIHPRVSPPQPVLIVDIDEESLAKYGQWPWPRTQVAELVRKLRDAPAIAVGFDIVFAEPDRVSPDSVAKSLITLDGAVRRELENMPTNDWIFSQVLRRTRAVLGQAGYHRELGDFDRPVRAPPLASLGGDPKRYLPRFSGIVRNLEILEDAVPGHGTITLIPDDDNIVRRVSGAIVIRDTVVPSLALEMLRVATGQSAFAVKSDKNGIRSLVVGGNEIPTGPRGRIWVRYAKHDPSRYVSAHAVLSGEVPRERLANKLILIGTSATGLYDVKATPLNPVMPGVEVHAQLLETILTQNFLARPNFTLAAELVMTALAGFLVVAIVPVLGAAFTMLLGAGVAAALMGLSWYLFVDRLILLDVAYSLIAGLAIYVPMVFVNYFREEAQRRQVRGAFSQYLSPELVEQLAGNPDQLVLGGQTKEMTVLFCDAHGFTAIAERYKSDPQGLTRLMNRLLTPLTNEIVARRGTIDKYMGDAIMAFWNAPLDDARHQANACETALAMVRALDTLNAERALTAEAEGRNFQPLRVGIGINSGECVVGNFGSDLRFDYTVLGDPVNVASRLEGQTRVYGVTILLGGATARAVAGHFAMLELDRLKVKGKNTPETIHALLGAVDTDSYSSFRALSMRHGQMLESYRTQAWDTALERMNACREYAVRLELPLIPYYDLMAARARTFQDNPPGPDWDGVTRAETK